VGWAGYVRPDAVLPDLTMPHMTGHRVFQAS
jgi:hypothetical protein